jgi:hypothetical protein
MTPKEKADEILKRMYAVHSDSASYITLYFAKKCALIAVDEILNNDGFTQCDIYLTEYWQQVKSELQSL